MQHSPTLSLVLEPGLFNPFCQHCPLNTKSQARKSVRVDHILCVLWPCIESETQLGAPKDFTEQRFIFGKKKLKYDVLKSK